MFKSCRLDHYKIIGGEFMQYPITDNLIPVNRYSRIGAHMNAVNGLVIHWTANTQRGADAMSNSIYFANLRHQQGVVKDEDATFASAHYNVDDHEIVRNLPESEMGYHVGAMRYNHDTLNLLNTTYPNTCTLGIEWCVNSDNDFNETWKRVGALAADICLRYNLDPMTHMIRHYDVTYKDCPHFFTSATTGGEDAWAQFRAYVKSLMHPVSIYNVYQGNEKIAEFATYADAVVEGKKWANASVRLISNGSWVWTNMPEPTFTDTQDHWAKRYVDQLDAAGLLTHPDNHLFNPDKPITRGEVVTLMAKLLDKLQVK
jgi:N-acetyl-anhydromuramyl-L-alanine amidase AmpD